MVDGPWKGGSRVETLGWSSLYVFFPSFGHQSDHLRILRGWDGTEKALGK